MTSPRFDPVINVNWRAMFCVLARDILRFGAQCFAFWRAMFCVLALDGARDLAKGLPFARDFCCVAWRRAWRAI